MSEHEVFTRPSSATEINAPGRRLPRRVRLAGYAAGIGLTVGLVALAIWLVTTLRESPAAVEANVPVATAMPTAAASASAQWQRPVVSAAGLADRSGVRIVYVAVTGGGGLIDLRYQVVDPDKAVVIHDDAKSPVIVDDATGVVVDQLLMGHSHTEGFKAGQTYYLIFENPGNLVQRGSKVSALLGNAQVEHVTVQ